MPRLQPLYLGLRNETLRQKDWQHMLRTHSEVRSFKNGELFQQMMEGYVPNNRIQGICQATQTVYAINVGTIMQKLCQATDVDLSVVALVGPQAHQGIVQDRQQKPWIQRKNLIASLEELCEQFPQKVGFVEVPSMTPSVNAVIEAVRTLANKSLRRRMLSSLTAERR